MAKDHGPSVKDDKQYEGLRKKGMSKQRAAAIANDPDSSSKGGKASGSGKRRDTKAQGGTKAQKAAAGVRAARLPRRRADGPTRELLPGSPRGLRRGHPALLTVGRVSLRSRWRRGVRRRAWTPAIHAVAARPRR